MKKLLGLGVLTLSTIGLSSCFKIDNFEVEISITYTKRGDTEEKTRLLAGVICGDVAPKSAKNFYKLVESEFYNSTDSQEMTVHRIVKDFMIQGGDPEGNGTGGSDKEIKGEFSENGYDNPLPHTRGVFSMARGSEMDSASSQFFIVTRTTSGNTAALDGKYASFGRLLTEAEKSFTYESTTYDSFDILSELNAVDVSGETPEEDVIINYIKITNDKSSLTCI